MPFKHASERTFFCVPYYTVNFFSILHKDHRRDIFHIVRITCLFHTIKINHVKISVTIIIVGKGIERGFDFMTV